MQVTVLATDTLRGLVQIWKITFFCIRPDFSIAFVPGCMLMYVFIVVLLRISTQMLLSVIMLVSIHTIIFMSHNTLQSLPNQMEYASISAFCMQKSSCQVVLSLSSCDIECETPE